MSVLLITPPFTQLNTPYPATAYIKGFLNTLGTSATQVDLGLEVILEIFTPSGLNQVFDIASKSEKLSDNSRHMLALRQEYEQSIAPVIRFLQHKNPTLAYTISDGDFLPQAARFTNLEELDWAFGHLGIQDKARHLATLYLEDLGDLITEAIDPHFGFSRYAERLGRSATAFDALEAALKIKPGFIDQLLIQRTKYYIQTVKPQLVCLSVPFPGNLYGALRIGQYIKQHYPTIKVAMGGGYPNTELRSMSDARPFQYLDFITLDDGERPLQCLLEYLNQQRPIQQLKRTFVIENSIVKYYNGALERDIPFSQTGTPDYSDLYLDKYLSVIEVANPMHRLWSDGRWNKLTMAHGCYWKKCSFCDISLDYIKNYEPVTASILADRMETLIEQTGETGFHFVDEAAPPALMKDLALEIIHRKLKVTWWTNIRFEERFTADLCQLLKQSGCIAVSGGLEVASDRLLEKMQKGVSVEQVARVAHHFTDAGIMVHAYLMYGFPTQTAQETINSLEMVRQLFENGVLQSGFWHLFAMTAHSPVGIDPQAFGVIRSGPELGTFANNDLYHEDPEGADHEIFSDGLKKSLFNFMHGIGMDFPLQKWFDFVVPKPQINKNYIAKALQTELPYQYKDHAQIVWLCADLRIEKIDSSNSCLKVIRKQGAMEVTLSNKEADFLWKIWQQVQSNEAHKLTWKQFTEAFQSQTEDSILVLVYSNKWKELQASGLLVV